MKLLMLSVFKHNGEDTAPFRLAETHDVSSFGYFTRNAVVENMQFGARTVVQRTDKGDRQTIGLKDLPILVHVFVQSNGLAGVVIADEEYPQRVAFSLIQKTLDTFSEKVGDKWTKVTKDQKVEPPFMKDDLAKYQDPKNADKILKIQGDLDEIKEIMQRNIDEVLKRGETLDVLMGKSEDLSASSKQFYKKAKAANSCCRSW